MQNLQTIRRRIRSVQNTQKITQAMQLVAGAKLRRSQSELLAFRPYADRLKAAVARFLDAHPDAEHPFLDSVPGTDAAPAGLVIVSSDTGLCGTYNERVFAAANGFLRENPLIALVTVGKKGTRAYARRALPRLKEIVDWGGRYEPGRAAPLEAWLQQLFLERKVSSWWVAYTQFQSALRWRPVVERLLPMERSAPSGLAEKVIVEPDAPAVADSLLRRYASVQMRRILLEAFTSEHSARMIAMKNATENAHEMIKHLTLVRNKARQAAITKELIEVISGAQALT